MPSVRDLEKTETVTVPGELIPANQASSDNALALPNAFASLPVAQNPNDYVIPEADTGIYVGFASTFSPSWPNQQAAGLSDGSIFLSYDGQLHKKMPMQFWLMHCEAFKTVMLKSGQISYATQDLSKATIPPGVQGVKLETHLIAVVLVEHDGTVVPAKFDARGTKDAALIGPLNQLKAAMQPDWPRKSDAHRLAAAFTFPWGRVKHIVTTHPKTAKGSGNTYHQASATSAPSTIEEMKKLTEAFSDKKFQRNAELAMRMFNQRASELKQLVAQFAGR